MNLAQKNQVSYNRCFATFSNYIGVIMLELTPEVIEDIGQRIEQMRRFL